MGAGGTLSGWSCWAVGFLTHGCERRPPSAVRCPTLRTPTALLRSLTRLPSVTSTADTAVQSAPPCEAVMRSLFLVVWSTTARSSLSATRSGVSKTAQAASTRAVCTPALATTVASLPDQRVAVSCQGLSTVPLLRQATAARRGFSIRSTVRRFRTRLSPRTSRGLRAAPMRSDCG
jgi:hypothetical protein